MPLPVRRTFDSWLHPSLTLLRRELLTDGAGFDDPVLCDTASPSGVVPSVTRRQPAASSLASL